MRNADGPEILQGPLSPEDWIAAYRTQDIVIATRAHSAVFALTAGTPVVAISYGPKGVGIMERVGLGEFTLSIESVSSDAILSSVGRLQDNYTEIQARVAANVEGDRDALWRTSRSLFTYMVATTVGRHGTEYPVGEVPSTDAKERPRSGVVK